MSDEPRLVWREYQGGIGLVRWECLLYDEQDSLISHLHVVRGGPYGRPQRYYVTSHPVASPYSEPGGLETLDEAKQWVEDYLLRIDAERRLRAEDWPRGEL